MTDIIHAPHPGAQEAFLSSNVDDLFIGGEKGNGKSWLLLQEVLYDIDEKDGHAILFRRTTKDLEDLWHKAHEHYAGYVDSKGFNDTKHLITFPSGFRFRMSHLQYPKDVFNHTGQEYHLIMWDERPNFPRFAVEFMHSCLRTVNSKLKTRERSTGNPVGEGVAHVKARYINVLEPGEIGYFKTVNDRDVRANEEETTELKRIHALQREHKQRELEEHPELGMFESRMWIAGKRRENITLMKNDPGYEARVLDNLPENLKRAFKYGIWDSSDKPYQVVKTKDWENALNGPEVKEVVWAAIGSDYALSGDKCTVCSGRGNRVDRFKEYDGMRHNALADILEKEMSLYGKFQVTTAVDANGQGSGVYTELQDRGHENLHPCTYKDDSFSPKINKETEVKLKFDTFRSLAIWKLGQDLADGLIDLSPLQSAAGYYDNLHLLEEEVLFHTYTQVGDKMVIISNNEVKKVQMGNGSPGLGRSADRFMALVYWNWVRGWKPSQPAKDEYKDGQDYSLRRRRKQTKRSAWA